MKKLITLCATLLFVVNCYSQEEEYVQVVELSPEMWSSMTQKNAFDGNSIAALIVGTSDVVGSPILSVNKTNGQPMKVFLSYFPAGICGPTNLTIKFKDEKTFYDVPAVYSAANRRYTIQFNDRLTIQSFIEKCKTLEKFYIRMTSRCVSMDVEFTLEGAPEALETLQ